MTLRRATPNHSPGNRVLLALALLALAVAAPAAAGDLVPALPYQFALGSPNGFATARDVDPARSRHAAALPASDVARIAWQRQVPGGVSCNVLVDEERRVFIPGLGRVTQLGPDGALQYSQTQGFSGAAAAALLADGTRAVLIREGRVLGWWPSGALAFDVALDVPAATSTSSLLPLPDGGALASVGQWLFEIDATRVVRAHASLPSAIQHTLLAGRRAIVIDEQGRVFEWDRREPLRSLGAFGSPVLTSAIDGDSLIALSSRGSTPPASRRCSVGSRPGAGY